MRKQPIFTHWEGDDTLNVYPSESGYTMHVRVSDGTYTFDLNLDKEEIAKLIRRLQLWIEGEDIS